MKEKGGKKEKWKALNQWWPFHINGICWVAASTMTNKGNHSSHLPALQKKFMWKGPLSTVQSWMHVGQDYVSKQKTDVHVSSGAAASNPQLSLKTQKGRGTGRLLTPLAVLRKGFASTMSPPYHCTLESHIFFGEQAWNESKVSFPESWIRTSCWSPTTETHFQRTQPTPLKTISKADSANSPPALLHVILSFNPRRWCCHTTYRTRAQGGGGGGGGQNQTKARSPQDSGIIRSL